jgi:hypothetical protein
MLAVAFSCARPAPNLVVDGARARSSAGVDTVFFQRSECPVVEGCVLGSGPRRLLRFDLVIQNRGDADAVVGPPVGPAFQPATCHLHPHYLDFARFTLRHLDGGSALAATKMGGCFRDDEQLDGGRAGLRYSCDDQGLGAGYADVYARDLDCQWLDVTGLPAGDYQLEVEINSDRRIAESWYDDDRVAFPVQLP